MIHTAQVADEIWRATGPRELPVVCGHKFMVNPVPGKGGSITSHCDRTLILVVGEEKVSAATVDVEL